MGKGPSINNTNFDLIKGETIIGVNTLYKLLDKAKINCKYFVVTDRIAWNEHIKNIIKIDTIIFLGYVASRLYAKNKSKYNIHPFVIKGKKTIRMKHRFPKDISEYVYVNGPTVVFIALQIAYYLGFKEVYLLGCDSTYSGKSHFDGLPAPFKRKGKSEKKHWELVFKSYEVCKDVYEKDNRKIINCTVGGRLEVFERKKLEDII